jgi:hypothetical protein
MTRDEHARFEELAAGHAVNALEPGDEEAFLAHLPSCAACERTLAEHIETAAHLAYAVDPVPLPDALLGRIRAEVAASGRAMHQPAAPAADRAPAAAVASIDARRAFRRRTVLSRAWVGVAAGAALVLSLLSWNLALLHGRSGTEERADRLASAVALLERSDRLVPLADDSGRAVATAAMEGDRKMSLVVDGLAANDRSSSTYVLWQTGATGARPVAAFDVRADGVDVVRDLPLVTTFPGWTGFAVTREPGRTAPSVPGSPPVAHGTLGA